MERSRVQLSVFRPLLNVISPVVGEAAATNVEIHGTYLVWRDQWHNAIAMPAVTLAFIKSYFVQLSFNWISLNLTCARVNEHWKTICNADLIKYMCEMFTIRFSTIIFSILKASQNVYDQLTYICVWHIMSIAALHVHTCIFVWIPLLTGKETSCPHSWLVQPSQPSRKSKLNK